MRAVAVWASLLLLVAPAAGALIAPAPPPIISPLPADIKDADVLALLALEMGTQPTRLPLPTVDASTPPVSTLVLQLGERAGLPITPEDTAQFDALDPQIKLPLTTLLLAVHEAWTLHENVFARYSQDEIRAALIVPPTGTPTLVLDEQQTEDLVNAAILLSETLESIVIPQLEAAAQAGVWPATAVGDPVGVIRIGGTGNDRDNLDRLLQIDARGDDIYNNSAGGATIWVSDLQYRRPIALSLDLSGNDTYRHPRGGLSCFGGASMGIALFYDLAGNDQYFPTPACTGFGNIGVGLFRDRSGNDLHWADGQGLGYGNAHGAIGYYRDDAGDDRLGVGSLGGGVGSNEGLGVYWDQGGADRYDATLGSSRTWGYATQEGHGWFVDETDSVDTWRNLISGAPHPTAGNDRTWSAGETPGGRGNDNRGGLAYLVGWQDPFDGYPLI